jgi:hypothetical protein
LDGAYVSVDTVTPATSNLPIQNVGIGSRRDVSPGQYWNGGISHVEFHSVEVSTAYISMFDDMMDQSTFWGTWTWETSGGGGGATVIEGLHRIAMGERQGASQGLGGVLQE